ncbi:MAG: hypothetical protein WCC86_01300 [Methanoregula sp.]|uniref:hypothetical protein n=1 Tax=Methanoregula sp. TaxID=2052170 RepID=UPI003BAF8970
MDDSSGYYPYTAEFPSVAEIEKWVAGHPNATQLAEIIARSYDYVRQLPFKGMEEHYLDNSDFSLS